MARRLARCLDSIVATGAGSGGGEMVEARDVEGPYTMALVAIEIGRHVVGGLAGGEDAVVADHAAPRSASEHLVLMAVAADHYTVGSLQREAGEIVIELGGAGTAEGNTKAGGIMAGVAVLTYRHVAARHTQSDTAVMAALAMGRQVFVIVVDVAGLAFQAHVGALCGNAGGFVIVALVVLAERVRGLHKPGKGGRQQQNRERGPDPNADRNGTSHRTPNSLSSRPARVNAVFVGILRPDWGALQQSRSIRYWLAGPPLSGRLCEKPAGAGGIKCIALSHAEHDAPPLLAA